MDYRDIIVQNILSHNFKCYDIPKQAIKLGLKITEEEYKVIGEYIFGKKIFNEYKNDLNIQHNKDTYILLCSIQIGKETQDCKKIKIIGDKYDKNFYRILSYKMFEKNLVDNLVNIMNYFDRRISLDNQYMNTFFYLCELSSTKLISDKSRDENKNYSIYQKYMKKSNNREFYNKLKQLFMKDKTLEQNQDIFYTVYYVLLLLNSIVEKYNKYNIEDEEHEDYESSREFRAYVEQLKKYDPEQFSRINLKNTELKISDVLKVITPVQYKDWLILQRKLNKGTISISDVNPDYE